MSITPFTSLACPLDGEPLNRSGNTWRCLGGHCFDIAKQGYVNLLPVQQKRSHDPGDSKGMVAARQRFLNHGYYQPIAELVNDYVTCYLEDETVNQGQFKCLDAGCGEGYYLRQLAKVASGIHPLELMGLDISKWSVLAAAKQDAHLERQHTPQASWVVGSNAHLPVQAKTLDGVLCMFGFPVYSEFFRVLKPGGLLLQVEAGEHHLRELREIIYPSLKPSGLSELRIPEGFVHRSVRPLSYELRLEGSDVIGDLLAMTPHFYRATAQGRARAAALDSLKLTVDVRLIAWASL